MTRAFRAELLKLGRPRLLLSSAALSAVGAIAAALIVVLPAEDGTSVTRAGGATEAFATVAGFTGILVFAVFIANVAQEFSQGTFRALALRQPDRVALITGKLLALLAFAAGLLAMTLMLSVLASILVAAAGGVETSGWASGDGLADAASDYGRVLTIWVTWGALGTAVAVLVRSTPLALGIGIAWSGPIEHLVQDGWQAATRWFPGLMLERLDTDGVTARTLTLLTIYVALAAVAAAITLRRRDITT